MEKLWNESRVRADVAALDRLLDEGWTVTHGDGRAIAQEERTWLLWPLRQVSYQFIGTQVGLLIERRVPGRACGGPIERTPR